MVHGDEHIGSYFIPGEDQGCACQNELVKLEGHVANVTARAAFPANDYSYPSATDKSLPYSNRSTSAYNQVELRKPARPCYELDQYIAYRELG
jgi:hypothetical protein